jgi:hypothetical protein
MTTDAEMRAWLKANGYNVGTRGRLKAIQKEIYKNAHPSPEAEAWSDSNE